jgi:predicted RNA-binding Zn-ribbon protein involved in translation (DUF1610 family)
MDSVTSFDLQEVDMAENFKCDCGHTSADPQTCDDCEKILCPKCYEEHHYDIAVDSATGKPILIELHDAFMWDCDNCGKENIHRTIRCSSPEQLSKEEREMLRQQLEIESWEDIPPDEVRSLIAFPFRVTCKDCDTSFLTVPPPDMNRLGDVDGDTEEYDPDAE